MSIKIHNCSLLATPDRGGMVVCGDPTTLALNKREISFEFTSKGRIVGRCHRPGGVGDPGGEKGFRRLPS